MNEQKLTPWFAPEVPPVRIGVYQTNDDAFTLGYPMQGYQHWNGARWGLFGGTPEAARLGQLVSSSYQGNHWRGLAEKPA